MFWSPLTFGKYKGKTLPQVIFSDPDWFYWGCENGVFKGKIGREAQEIFQKANAIKVPQAGGKRRVVQYIIDKPTGKFGIMKSVEYNKGLDTYDISDYIDFSVPRRLFKYDKTGYKNFVPALKKILFGNARCKMKKKKCEDFFDDENNFAPNKDGVLKI